MADDFVTICEVCTKGITRADLKYAHGKAFHNQCFLSHGKNYGPVDNDLLNNTTRAKVELVQLKNLKARMMGETKSKPKRKSSKKKKKAKRKSTRKKSRVKSRKKSRQAKSTRRKAAKNRVRVRKKSLHRRR